MSYFDDIFEFAVDNYGLVTSKEASAMGIPNIDLVKMERRGQLERLGYGVYRLTKYFPSSYDKYAEAVTLVGEDSYVFGESVLAMHGLALVNPARITIATPRRVRKKLPRYINPVPAKVGTEVTHHEGIPSQCVASAIRECYSLVMHDRLLAAVEDARGQGLVSEREAIDLKDEIQNGF